MSDPPRLCGSCRTQCLPQAGPRWRLRRIRRAYAPSHHVQPQPHAVAVATCRCYCKYCAFATHQPHLHAPERCWRCSTAAAAQRKGAAGADRRAAGGQRRVRGAPREHGFEDFGGLRRVGCEQALERGLSAAHQPRGAGARDLARLREVTASQGLMLESVTGDLVAHQGSPTKHPARAASTRSMRPASSRSRSRAGSWLGSASAMRSGGALEALAAVHAATATSGGDPPELRPAPAYYGQEPAEIADAARASTGAPGSPEAPCRCAAVGDARSRWTT